MQDCVCGPKMAVFGAVLFSLELVRACNICYDELTVFLTDIGGSFRIGVYRMSYEEILNKVGSFGRYQKRLCLYLVISSIPNGYLVLSIVFVGMTPSHRCYVPDVDGTTASNSSDSTSQYQNLDSYLPRDEYNKTSQCTMYIRNTSSRYITYPQDIVDCQHGWVYDIEEGRQTFVTEWNLVCDRAWMRPTITSLFMAGVLVGATLCGILSDRFGRRPVFLAGTFSMFLFFGLCGISSSPAVYMAMLFMSGATNMVNYATAFVLGSEIIDTKNRVMMGTFTISGFALGYMLIPLIAFLITNWKMIYIVSGLSGLLFIPYYWLIPESPRWLYSRRKFNEFRAIMRKIAAANGVAKDDLETLFDGLLTEDEQVVADDVITRSLFLQFIRHRVAKLRAFNIAVTWFTNAVIYYGISLNTSNLGGNPYLNCFIAAAVEIPAYALVMAILQRAGRKTLMISTILLSGVACGIVPFLDKVSVAAAVIVAMVGKFAISASYAIVYIFSAELFPTPVRNSAVGFGSMTSRFGACVAPYLLYLGETNKILPYMIMLLLSLVSSLLTCFLPETGDKPLPDQFHDLESYRPRFSFKTRPKEKSSKHEAHENTKI